MDNFHGSATQHIAGSNHQRITQLLGFLQSFCFSTRSGIRRLAQTQGMQHLLKPLSVFSGIDHVRTGADDGHAFSLQTQRQFQRRLPAILNNHAEGLFFVHNFKHILQRQRFKIQTVAGVVVGGHCFGVAIDHDGLVTIFAHGQCSMHAAVIKLNTLTDSVGTTSQHHDFFLVGRCRFTLLIVGRIHVRCVGGKFCSTCVYSLENRSDAHLPTGLANGFFGGFELLG